MASTSALQALLALSEAVIVVSRADERLVRWNAAAAALLGEPATGGGERSLVDLFPGVTAAARARALEGTAAPLEWIALDARGAALPLQLTFSRVPSRPPVSVGILRRLPATELAPGQESAALAESEQRFRTLAESSLSGIVLHENGVIIEVNSAFARMLGYAPEELLGRTVVELAAPEVRASVAERLGNQNPRLSEVEACRKDGTRLDLEVVAAPILYRGRMVRLAALRDVTESKRLTSELLRQNDQLKALDVLKSHFISTASHELRTPLASVLGYSEFLEDGLGGPLTPQQTEFVQAINQGALRLQRLIDDLLDSAQMEAGVFRFVRQETDLLLLVRQLATSLRPQLDRGGLSLSFQLPEAGVWVMADPQRIEQVLLNLVGNAIKFTPSGGRIDIELACEERSVVFRVRDTGPGIAPDGLPRLFEKFYQVDTTLTRAHGGAGLGLAIAKAIIEGHEGRIGVESTLGEGSCFWFSLDRTVPEGAREAAG